MANDGLSPVARGQLRREALHWFVQMRSEDAEKLKPEFEAWLARGAMNRAFYNRVANLYGATKNVNWENLPSPQPIKGAVRWSMLVAVAGLLLLSFVAWRIVISPLAQPGTAAAPSGTRIASMPREQLMTRLGEIRRVRLPDGSYLILDTDSLVTTDFGTDRRELRLERGRARFDVAHERRPFVVDAGNSEIVAHGTMFDVAMEDDQAKVTLLRGAVDVSVPVSHGRVARTVVAHLRPGEGVRIPDTGLAEAIRPSTGERISDWPSGLLDFDDTALSDVIMAANRYSTTKIRLADPRLASIGVSGTFHVDEGAELANQLAQLLGLVVSYDGDAVVLTSRQK